MASKTLVLDLAQQTQGLAEHGLLNIAFHPDFGQPTSPHSGEIYLYYQYTRGPITDPRAPLSLPYA